jgi:S-adenosylmethionine hydrolase
MADPIITLTTDFGEESPYVAAMKGVVLGINPAARLVDLSHQVPPQDVRHAAFLLAAAVPYFPPSVIHVVVVDPGVGTERALLYVETDGHRLLVPDNGCWTLLARISAKPPVVRRLTEPRFWRHSVSATFHGRDILAPVAARLSLGTAPQQLGPLVDDWVRLEIPAPRLEPDRLTGEVILIDRFGNLITNIPGDAFAALAARPVRIAVGEAEVPRCVRTYAEVEPGALVSLISSFGTLEVAVNRGNAAERLQAAVGTPIQVAARS